MLLRVKASTGSARNGNLVLAPNLFVRAKKFREICGRDHRSEQGRAGLFQGNL